jgi:hypothetical protein
MSSERSPWEYKEGPQVGRDVSITNEPRDEEAPGIPRAPSRPVRQDDGPQELEEREVKVADPKLDDAANEQLTAELREVLGTDRVQVPKDQLHPSRGDRPPTTGLWTEIISRRLTVVMMLAAALTIGAIVSLATGSWWLLLVALGVHALGTVVVTATVLRMTTTSERVAPTTAAMLQEEGIDSPDEYFSLLVEEFSETEHGGAGDVVSAGDTARTSESSQEPGQAAAEQSAAMTPSSGASQPTEGGGVADGLMWATVAALFAVSLIVPATAGGGAMWILPVVMLPLLLGWILIQGVWKRAK